MALSPASSASPMCHGRRSPHVASLTAPHHGSAVPLLCGSSASGRGRRILTFCDSVVFVRLLVGRPLRLVEEVGVLAVAFGFEAVGRYDFMVGSHADEDMIMRKIL